MAALFASITTTTIAAPPPRHLREHDTFLTPVQKGDVVSLYQNQQGVPGSSCVPFRAMQGRSWGGIVDSRC